MAVWRYKLDNPSMADQDTYLVLEDAAATQQFGEMLGRSLPPGTVLLLQGDLGAGKTTLVQGIGLGLGIADPILSPTFTLINEYLEGRIPLYHLDLYRLEPAEVEELHLEDYWNGEATPGIVAIEWAERLPVLPKDYLHLTLTLQPDESRLVQVKTAGSGSAG